MEDFNNLVTAKNNLMTSLGPNFTAYMKYMKKWFKMECTKLEFDNRVKKIMTPQQVELHNSLLIELFKMCTGLVERPPSPASCKSSFKKPEKHVSKKQRTSSNRQHGSIFQNFNVLDYASDDFLSGLETEIPETMCEHYSDIGKCVLEEDVLYGRLTTAAWESELDGTEKDAARILTVATKNLLKNILTAVLGNRNGYKVRDDSFMYEIGAPIINPWFQTAPKQYGPRYWNDPYYYGLYKTPEESEGARTEKPVASTSQLVTKRETDLEALNKERYESLKKERYLQNCVSASTRVNCNLNRSLPRQKVTLQELYNALRVNRSLILSQHVYVLTMERILSCMSHCAYDDVE